MEQLKAARVPSRLSALLRAMLAAEPAARPGVRTLTARLSECRGQVRDRRKVARRLAIAAGLTGLAVTVFMLNRPGPPDAEPGMLSGKSIAVLQFESRSQDKNDAYVASGVRNEIVTKLAQVRGLRVAPCSSGQPADLRELGRKLGAANFLGASVQKTADSILIEVQLIEAQTGAQLWSQSYKHGLTEVSEVAGEVAEKVAEALQVKLAPAEAQRLRAAFTSNPRAHDLYLRAYALSANSDEQSHEQQIAMLSEAVAEDPGYAGAWSALSGAYINLGDVYRAPREILLPARDAAIKAVALDDQLSHAHVALAGIALTYDWNFPVAKREFERSIALDPNSSLAHMLYGWYLAHAERNFVAARQEGATARRLDPLNPWVWWAESVIALAQGDYEGALRLAERVMEIYPQFFYDEDPIAHVYVAMGRWDDAVKRYESIPASRFNCPNFELAICYAHTGQIARARDILEKLEKLAQQRYVDHTHIAAIHAALGDNHRAFAALDQAILDRSARVYAPRFYPWLVPLHEDPRFVELENKIAHSQLPQSALPEKSIAVLPFKNLSEEKANAFFADGMQDEILTNLSRIRDLKVTSRTSVMNYKTDVERNSREIGRQLGVAHLLEGSVQRSGNHVRVIAQLIDTGTDGHVWAQTYDGDLANVFAIQSEIAKAIADQLQARLSPTEKAAIEQRPTADLAAFDFYARAKTLRLTANFGPLFKDRLLQAIDFLNQAVARDPAFLLAWCELAASHDVIYFAGYDHAPARLALANDAIQTALRLQPDAGGVRLALAQHLYHGYRDYDRARMELEIARRTLPNSGELFALAGYIDRRQGRWAESTRNLERAVELDPRNSFTLGQIAVNYGHLRRYAEATVVLDRVLAIAPKDVLTRVSRGWVDLEWRADPRPLRRTIDAILAEDPAAAPILAGDWLFLALCERDLASADRALAALNSDEALTIGHMFLRYAFGEGLVARLRGDEVAARAAFTTARVQQEEAVRMQPEHAPTLCVLGLIDAALGRKEDALRESRRAVELLPIERDSLTGADMIVVFAIICAWTGESDLAFQQLAIAIQNPGLVSYGQLKLHPFWDPLRGDPRFEKIVASLAPK